MTARSSQAVAGKLHASTPTLISYLSEPERNRCYAVESSTGIYQHDTRVVPIEARLARQALSMRILPQFVGPSHFTLAMEDAYAPPAGFRCSIDPECFVDEFEPRDPAYMEDAAMAWNKFGLESFREGLLNEIRTRQLDEFCATWLLTMPKSQHHDNRMYDLLHDYLHSSGQTTHLRYLELDGVKAVRHVRQKLDELQ
ncbi:hypothetical protein DID96_36575 [Burkholderia sp. Bp8963]|nr:hypothetical protein DID96_36575 [Burkholderia sp. Bp8963]